MNRILYRTIRWALTSVLVAGLWLYLYENPPRAQVVQTPQMPSFEQVSLTKDMVTRFLKAFPQLMSMTKKYSKNSSGGGGPLGSVSGLLNQQQARREMDVILGAHGYNGYAEWVKVAQSVALAYGYAKSGKDLSNLSERTNQAIAGIENNPRLSTEQKARLKAAMSAQMGMVSRFQPLPENVALVKSMMPEIAAVMDSN